MPVSNPTLLRLTALLTLLGVVVLVAMVSVSIWMLERTRGATEEMLRIRGQRSAMIDLFTLVQDAETGQRGFLLTGEDRYLAPYEEASRQIGPAFAKMRAGLPEDAQGKDLAEALKKKIDEKLAEIKHTVELKRAGKADDALAVVLTDQGKDVMDQIRTFVRARMDRIDQQLYASIDNQRSNANGLWWANVVGGFIIVLAGLGTAWALTVYTREIIRARSEVESLAAGLDARVKERTGELQRANDEIQRFAYIVSHDLRAPLVNVMGFTSELQASLDSLQSLIADPVVAQSSAGEAAKQAVTVDVPEALSFIRASTKKMDNLINAILKLSREGQRTLNPEAINLDALFEGISANVQHRLSESEGELAIQRPLATIVSDRLALEQVFGNIIDNAIKYKAPGRPPRIEVNLTSDRSGFILVQIKDNGRGIGKQDFERVFDLFRRAGSQDQPGEGIGLAHVRALVRRLGGQISLESELGVGTTFYMTLPRNLRIRSEQAGDRG